MIETVAQLAGLVAVLLLFGAGVDTLADEFRLWAAWLRSQGRGQDRPGKRSPRPPGRRHR